MDWRPEGWDSPYPSKTSFVAQREAFEAGADAMLEALRRRGFLDMGTDDSLNITGVYDYPIKFTADCFGKLVLIPYEEGK